MIYENYRSESVELGPWTSYSLKTDPKHLSFVLSRYKFCSKILRHKKSVMEIGFGDAFGLPIVAQHKRRVLAIDNDRDIVDQTRIRMKHLKNINFICHDMCNEYWLSPNKQKDKDIYESAISIDVIEHIDPQLEHKFISNICEGLSKNAVFIVGTPNIVSEPYASPQSKTYHINLHSANSLYQLMNKYFANVLQFGMNDEIVHTGFDNMCHYLFAIGIGKK